MMNEFEQDKSGKEAAEKSKSSAKAKKPKKSGRFAKSDVRYWLAAVKRPTYTRNGETFESPYFMVSIQRRGKRVGMSLETGNRDAAARRAMEMFEYVRANGWEAGLAKYRPAMHRKGADPTVGEFIEAVRATSSINKPTLETYFRALRRLAADIAGVERGPSMFDMSHGGRGGRQGQA
jgi:hypothetical protein